LQRFEAANGQRLQVVRKKLCAVPSGSAVVEGDSLFHLVFLPDGSPEDEQVNQLNTDGSIADPRV
jgi:hypothetical protein